MAVKTFSISMDERAFHQVKSEADRTGASLSAWIARAAREKLQRDAAALIPAPSEDDFAWADQTEADFDTPEAGGSAG